MATDDGAAPPAGRITDYIRNLVVKAERQGHERGVAVAMYTTLVSTLEAKQGNITS